MSSTKLLTPSLHFRFLDIVENTAASIDNPNKYMVAFAWFEGKLCLRSESGDVIFRRRDNLENLEVIGNVQDGAYQEGYTNGVMDSVEQARNGGWIDFAEHLTERNDKYVKEMVA